MQVEQALVQVPAGAQPVDEIEYRRICDFLHDEAELLCEMDYRAWGQLLTDDIHYLMPVPQFFETGKVRQIGPGTPYFDEDADSLRLRITLLTDPASTTAERVHSAISLLIGNVRAWRVGNTGEVGCQYRVRSRFQLSRVRPGRDGQPFELAGRREDVLRETAHGLRLARRSVHINQSIIKAANLSFFI